MYPSVVDVLKLGTNRHHKDGFLDSIDDLKNIGCFGLTELGYGNNAVEMVCITMKNKKSICKKCKYIGNNGNI